MKRSPMAPRKKPLRKVNPVAQAKRRAKLRAWYRSPEYQRQRNESLKLAHHQCQARFPGTVSGRCPLMIGLEMHEIKYRFGRSEPKDRIIYCKRHHQLVERIEHPTRHDRRTR